MAFDISFRQSLVYRLKCSKDLVPEDLEQPGLSAKLQESCVALCQLLATGYQTPAIEEVFVPPKWKHIGHHSNSQDCLDQGVRSHSNLADTICT